MEVRILVSSVVLALFLTWIQSMYWGVKLRVWIPAALLIGLATAAIVDSATVWIPDLALLLLLVIEGVLICALTAALTLVWFFRDPKRVPPERDGVILSPADGRIIYVKRVEDESHFVSVKSGTRFPLDELLQTPWPFKGGHLIGIEMNVMDVHVNRAPIGGKVVLRKRIKGGFPGLGKPNAEVRSERFTTVIENGSLQVGVVQIASRFVRGIVSWVQDGQQVEMSQRIGMIRFGSQVDVAIPNLEDYRIDVAPGQRVWAGLTVIARHRQQTTTSS